MKNYERCIDCGCILNINEGYDDTDGWRCHSCHVLSNKKKGPVEILFSSIFCGFTSAFFSGGAVGYFFGKTAIEKILFSVGLFAIVFCVITWSSFYFLHRKRYG